MTTLSPLLAIVLHSWKRWRVMAADREAFAPLDESSFRDLGIGRSEIHSFPVDAQAIQSSTRRRVAK
jgi:uncharacterized protein YjiS (DUF1127 family)